MSHWNRSAPDKPMAPPGAPAPLETGVSADWVDEVKQWYLTGSRRLAPLAGSRPIRPDSTAHPLEDASGPDAVPSFRHPPKD